jgi:hypothetical protein
VLRADSFPVPEVCERLRNVYGLPGSIVASTADPVRGCIIDYLRLHDATYLDLPEEILTAALTLARPWAETYAHNLVASSWPPPEILGGEVQGGLDALAGYGKAELGRDVRRLRARAMVGDEVRTYSTAPLMWAVMMGSGGLALVRDGRSIDYMQTRMN